jgi:hypothetical protein
VRQERILSRSSIWEVLSPRVGKYIRPVCLVRNIGDWRNKTALTEKHINHARPVQFEIALLRSELVTHLVNVDSSGCYDLSIRFAAKAELLRS